MWHGVPVVAIPSFSDQPENADRLVGLGAAVALVPLETVQPDALYEAIMKVISDSSFRKNASRVSANLRLHKRSGTQRAAGPRYL